jgi:Tol biopolymer transport system component
MKRSTRKTGPQSAMSFWCVALSALVIACGDGGTGPSAPPVGPIGPIPEGLTGKVAFVTSAVVATSNGSHTESRVHVIDMADPIDRVVYAAPNDVSIEGLSWHPNAQQLVVQTLLFQVDANGHNQSTWQLHSVNATGSQDFILFPSSLPKYHPSYGPDGRLAYFSGWSDDPNAGIFIDAHPTHSVPYAGASHLSWRPDASAIIYSGPGIGLQELTLESGAVTELLPLEGGETIQAPAVSADGTRIALVRLGGSRNSQEIWTADASGANPQQLTTGSSDDSPAWTPNDSYLAFSRWVSTSPGIYVMPAGGGTPVRVVSVSPGAGSMNWSR